MSKSEYSFIALYTTNWLILTATGHKYGLEITFSGVQNLTFVTFCVILLSVVQKLPTGVIL